MRRHRKWSGPVRGIGVVVISRDACFVLGPQKWSIALFLAIGTLNYAYKFFMAVAMTPVIYLAHALIDRYLGDEAPRMKEAASTDSATW